MTNGAFDIALYATAWLAIVMFIAGEAGRTRTHPPSPTGTWPLVVWSAGAALLAAHILLALHVHHAWSHQSVVRAVADQSRQVYGIGWGGAAWMNYTFLGLWLVELFWWGMAPRSYFARPASITAACRGFYLVILVNAAVVFAAPPRRLLGMTLMIVLLWLWRHTLRDAALHRRRALAHSSHA